MTANSATTSPLPSGPVSGMTGFMHHHATANGARIHFVVGGEGPAVVLLHGYPYTWAVWSKLMPALSQSGFTVVAPDLRGLGDSEKAKTGYEKGNVADDIWQIVQSLGFDTINLVGTDIGAMVAYSYAAHHPSNVRRLVFAESLIPGFGLEEIMNPATGGLWHFGFHMQVDIAERLTAGKEIAYLLPTMTMMSLSEDAEERARKVYLPPYIEPGGMRAGFKHYETLLEDGRENQAAFRSKLPMPVLVLNGEKSESQEGTLKSVQQVAENVEADLVPNSHHNFSDDNPSWVADRLRQFFVGSE